MGTLLDNRKIVLKLGLMLVTSADPLIQDYDPDIDCLHAEVISTLSKIRAGKSTVSINESFEIAQKCGEVLQQILINEKMKR